MSNKSNSAADISEEVSVVKIRSSFAFDGGLEGTMYTPTLELGRYTEFVPYKTEVKRIHTETGCTSLDMITGNGGKSCIDCSLYPYRRDITNACNVEYHITGLIPSNLTTPLTFVFTGPNWALGEALYRVLNSSIYENPWDIVLEVTSKPGAQFQVTRSPNSSSEKTANAIANLLRK